MNIKNIINKIGLFTLPLLGGWLGAFAGADKTSKNWRRILIPGLLTSYAYFNVESLFVISIMSMCGALSLGYGIPDSTDEGSALGKFWFHFFDGDNLYTNIFTRGTIGFLIAISLISVPIIKHNWLIYGLGSLGIILANALISWRNFGSYKLFDKILSWVEIINWGLITLFGVLIIYLK